MCEFFFSKLREKNLCFKTSKKKKDLCWVHWRLFLILGNPESWKDLLVESRIWEIFACGIQILDFGILIPFQVIWRPTNGCDFESKFHCLTIWNPVPGIWNSQHGIQNPRLFWDPLAWCKKFIQLTTGYFPRW